MKNEKLNSVKSNFLVSMLFLQFIVLALIFFDVPVARQVVVFLYLTFVPGLILLRLLKLGELSTLETVLFSIGFSLAFLMLTGLLINGLCPLFGVLRPLSIIPLMIILNSLIFVGIILVYLKGDTSQIFQAKVLRYSLLASPLIVPLILSVIGAMRVNASENNMFLMIMLAIVALIFAIFALSKKVLFSRFYALLVFIIAISLLYHSSLISSYIYTGDIHIEYLVFKTVHSDLYWHSTNPFPGSTEYGAMYSMLSVTILPTIYSNLMNMDPTWTFKIIFPFIFSFVPLGLYQLWRGYLGKKYAFISAFFFMAYETFYTEMLGLNRQMIAELFFVLLLIVISSNKLKRHNRFLCFTIFSFGLVASHYGLSVIFLFFISVTFILLILARRASRNVTISMVILFFVIMFAWYIFTTGSAAFEDLLSFSNYIYNRLGDFFNPMSREENILRGLGLESPPTIWHAISRGFAYITEAFIVVGFIGLIMRRVKVHFGREYFTLTLVAVAFLAALILIPGLADTMNMTRFYHILLFFLAPLCVMGAETIVGLVSKHRVQLKALVLLVIVLVPYFLFQTCFVFELVKTRSSSIPLSRYRMNHAYLMVTFAYVNSWKAFGASWLNSYVKVQNAKVYRDWSAHELTSYGMLGYTLRLSNTTRVPTGGMVYLSYLNVVDGLIVTTRYNFNSTELSFIPEMDRIYSNGGCQVYIASK